MSDRLTMVCVHAHPDDESSSTGGVLRTYADQGIRTVLVTCTDGALGDAPDGATPDHEGHHPDDVAAYRAKELRTATEILKVTRVEQLGFKDSGMEGWPQNDAPESFWSTPVDVAAKRLVPILLEERPQVIVTYDERGFYGHPDHIQAHRVTVAALELSGITASLFYTAIPKSGLRRFREIMREAGVEPPEQVEDDEPEFGTPDELIGVRVDVSAVADAKFDALSAHGSQTDNSFFLKMGRDRFRTLFGTEWFVRAVDPVGRTGVDDDLFAGYRS